MELYKLEPAYQSYIWGGDALIRNWNKHPETQPLAESWELSMHPSGKTKIAAGPGKGSFLSDMVPKEQYGTNAAGFDFFPVLIKLIDANSDLSVQVHPSDHYALEHEGEYGKTETWYILDAKPGAGIYCGLKEAISPEEYSRRIQDGSITEVLNFFPVQPGEYYMIPAGTVHAIGAGCLILEIQQNSNLTYRVYDYGRKDAQGNQRPLHIEKAKEVSDLTPYRMRNLPKTISEQVKLLGRSKYFSVYEYTCDNALTLTVDERSFAGITFIDGTGEIGGVSFQKGDSFFAPASLGEVAVKGRCRFVLTKLTRYYVGIDIGGTDIKGAIIDETGFFLAKQKASCDAALGSSQVVENITGLVNALLAEAELSIEDTQGIGIGCPGVINGEAGVVTYSNNLKWRSVPLVALLQKHFPVPMRLTNDANAAAVGEVRFGSGKQYHDAVLVTLGTGLGGGIVIDGKLFEGNQSAGAEIGHMVIQRDGELCTCGRHGCFEAYGSATGLIREAKKAALAHPKSKMWSMLPDGNLDKMNARIPFDCRHDDEVAAHVVHEYIVWLSEGIANIINIFRPQVIMLGGGVSNEREGLLAPLREQLKGKSFGGDIGPTTEIVVAQLGNDAGVFGAAALMM